MIMDENIFLENVLRLYKQNNWEEILKLSETSSQHEQEKLLWVWPSIENLNYIQTEIKQFNLKGVLSIGCGCGLFEWILQKYSGMSVIGFEINKPWWESKYSNPLFINHVYPKDGITLDSSYALFFCYFNNLDAFIEYVDSYNGPLIIIIGPGPGRGTYTEPDVFKPRFGKSQWYLYSFQRVKESQDFITLYLRDCS